MYLKEEKINFKAIYKALKNMDNKSDKFAHVLNLLFDLYQIEKQGRSENKIVSTLSGGKIGAKTEPKTRIQALKSTVDRIKKIRSFKVELDNIFKGVE